MFDTGLFAIAAVKLQRSHWQAASGKRTNAYMKDAGRKAAATRAMKGMGHEMAVKAVATRRARAAALRDPLGALDDAPTRTVSAHPTISATAIAHPTSPRPVLDFARHQAYQA